MHIEKLSLVNFRNYQNLFLDLDQKLNVFVGDNAQGKTNILEAIFYSGAFRSHRTNKDTELIKWQENYFIIKVIGKNQLGEFSLEIGLNREGKKKYKVNGVEKKRTGDILGTVKVVLFSPEDLYLVKGSPSVRRKFLDNEISQLNPSYYYNLLNYYKILGQRNSLLKDIRNRKANSDSLIVWDQQLAAFGSKLIIKRLDILKKLVPLTRLMHRKITNGKEELEIKYISNIVTEKEISSISELEKFFLDKLVNNRSEEINKGVTVTGPHRDDLSFFINNIEIKSYGSQGQQRTSSLSVKLAELELTKGETGEYPILLLDDVMSELDEDRRRYLLNTVQAKIQTFITTTDTNHITNRLEKEGKIFEVDQGTIIS